MFKTNMGRKQQLILIGFITWILLPVLGKAEETFLSPKEVEAIIPQIEAAEKSLRNIKIDAESWVEEKAPASAAWQKTPIYCSCTAWMDGGPRGKVRVDVHKEVLKWRDGAAPYSGESYSISFDGTNTKRIKYTAGPSDKQFRLKEGEILPGASEWLMSRFYGACTGWAYTMNYFYDYREDGLSFSETFRRAISPAALATEGFEFEFAYEEKNGIACLRFGSKPAKWGRLCWWFDPARGFALIDYLRTTKVNGIEHIASEIKVNKLQEVASGVWWPIEVTVESEPQDPNAPYTREIYKASKVVANGPNFDNSVFTLDFPKGYRVDDKVTGKKYVVDANSK